MGLCLPCSRARSGVLEASRRRDAVERGGDPCVGRRPLGLVSRHALLWATLTMLPVINLQRPGRCAEGAPCRSSLSAPHLWGGAPMILLRAPWKGFACFEIDYLWPKVQVYPTRTLGLRVRGPSGRIRVRILESTALRVAPRPRRLWRSRRALRRWQLRRSADRLAHRRAKARQPTRLLVRCSGALCAGCSVGGAPFSRRAWSARLGRAGPCRGLLAAGVDGADGALETSVLMRITCNGSSVRHVDCGRAAGGAG